VKFLIPSSAAVLALNVSVFANDTAAHNARPQRPSAKPKLFAGREIKSLKQKVQALQSHKTTGTKEYGDKVRAINAKKDVIRSKEAQ
jgi:hypothetical protein